LLLDDEDDDDYQVSQDDLDDERIFEV